MSNANEEELKLYNAAVARLEKKGIANVNTYANILTEDDETSRKFAQNASVAEIKRETELIIGPAKEWSCEKSEALSFRDSMNRCVFNYYLFLIWLFLVASITQYTNLPVL